MKIARLVLGLGVFLVVTAEATFAQSATPPSPSAQAQTPEAQSSSDALGSAAKRVRDDKNDKKDQTKTARVWDNDNIPKAGHEISVIGQKDDAANDAPADAAAAAPSGNATAAVAPGANGAPESSAKAGEHLHAQIDSAKEKLASLRTDLDLMQRTLVLDSQMYYGKPDYSNDTEGARKLQDEQGQIAAKQQAIEDVEKQIADLESQQKDAPSSETPPVNHD
jgi:hypothetical protein